MQQNHGAVSRPTADTLNHADTRAAIQRVAARAARTLQDAQLDCLQRAAHKAAQRRFSGAALTGFGDLS